MEYNLLCCFQWFKDTNLKANHNGQSQSHILPPVVSNGSKILIWKQITTESSKGNETTGCFQWFKDTNLKANHNTNIDLAVVKMVVSNGSKILIWKQITTLLLKYTFQWSCFQWFKDTNLKANHNQSVKSKSYGRVVSNGSKILIWKQITTKQISLLISIQLFPMVQRY